LEVLLSEFVAVGFDNPVKDDLTGSSEHHEPEDRPDGEFIFSLETLEHETEAEFWVIG
jgi:hypothetical protein